MKAKIEIKNRWTGKIIFEFETEDNTIAKTVRRAIEGNADLRSANLSSANLSSADLRSADLRSADLRSADLSSANLRSADLRSADLSSADLRSADLRSADLRSADLRSADLRSADLSSANLSSANLRSADLRSADLRSANLSSADLRSADLSSADLSSANLSSIKNDLWALLLYAIPEIANLKKAIVDGKINGSTYSGECACLCGTIEKTTDETLRKTIVDLRDSGRPIERFFLAINTGDTPESNHVSKIILGWIEEFERLILIKEEKALN